MGVGLQASLTLVKCLRRRVCEYKIPWNLVFVTVLSYLYGVQVVVIVKLQRPAY